MIIILVSSHRRSGTHFLIDSLRANIQDSVFPNHRQLPVDFNLGSLFSKDEKILNIFKSLINDNSTVIIKSHLLPEECNMEDPKDKIEEYIKEIYENSKKIYISRDGKDTLVSLYKFINPPISFSQFIREKNDHIVREIRSENYFDSNRVYYWTYHTTRWQLDKTVKQISFSDLSCQFDLTLSNISTFLDSPILSTITKPEIPKNKLWHGIRKKMNHYGFGNLPVSSSVRPNKGNENLGMQYFNDELDLEYYINNTTIIDVE